MVEGLLLALEHPNAVGESFNIGNAALGGDDLRPRARGSSGSSGCPGEHRLPADPLPRRRAADPERGQGARAARLRGARSSWTRVSSGRSRGTGRRALDVRLARPDVGAEELAEVAAVLESGQLTMGAKVAELEDELARACGSSMPSRSRPGTAALHLAVLALGIGPGDEVIVPAYTFPATANVVALAGATPVLVDVDPETFNLDPARVRASRRGRRRSCRGAPVRPPGAARGAAARRCRLIEDAAGALGARRRGQAVRRPRRSSAASPSTRARSSRPARAAR